MFSRSAVGLVLVALLAAACEKVPLLAPSASTITVSAPTRSLPPGGSTEITAVVVESGGTPVQNGTLVQFSATLGRVEPAEVETQGGVARTTFIAGSASGTAQIRAISGGAGGGEGTTPTNLVEIQIGAAAANAVAVSASPSRVPSSGGTVTIIASAVDASGNRLVGVPITFSSTQGSLSSSTATTDASGEARVSLTTNREATVTARVAGGTMFATTTVTVGTAGTVQLVVGSSAVAGSPTTLTINPMAGTAPRVVVNWGDGSIEDLGIVAATRTATHTYQSSGVYTISATATSDGESFTTSAPVTVSSAGVVLEAVTPANPTAGSPMTVRVTPTAGTAPRVVITWGDGTTTDLGVLSGSRVVAHTYESAGSYVISARATAGSETTETSLAVTVSNRPALSVNVSAGAGPHERCEPVTFTATVTPSTETVNAYEWRITNASGGDEQTFTTTGNQLTRIFSTTGTRDVTVTAVTPDGRRGTGQTQVLIVAETTPTSC